MHVQDVSLKTLAPVLSQVLNPRLTGRHRLRHRRRRCRRLEWPTDIDANGGSGVDALPKIDREQLATMASMGLQEVVLFTVWGGTGDNSSGRLPAMANEPTNTDHKCNADAVIHVHFFEAYRPAEHFGLGHANQSDDHDRSRDDAAWLGVDWDWHCPLTVTAPFRSGLVWGYGISTTTVCPSR